VLTAIADSLETSVQRLYADAGFVEPSPGDEAVQAVGLAEHIEAAVELTAAQRRALVEIYRGFVDANAVRRTRNKRAEP
jgi:hypothetical protein